jgi:cation transport regulator ChaC
VYEIDPMYADQVQAYMDHREKDGYSLEQVDVWGVVDGQETIIQKSVRALSPAPEILRSFPLINLACRPRSVWSPPVGPAWQRVTRWEETKARSIAVVSMQVYVGHSTNPSFLGPTPIPSLAARIASSVGPSGANKVRNARTHARKGFLKGRARGGKRNLGLAWTGCRSRADWE